MTITAATTAGAPLSCAPAGMQQAPLPQQPLALEHKGDPSPAGAMPSYIQTTASPVGPSELRG